MCCRKTLKERALIAFRRNYWKCVVAALIIMMLVGGVGSALLGIVTAPITAVLAVVFLIALPVVLAAFAVKVLLLNILEIGGDYFFLKNAKKPVIIDNLLRGFDDYGKNVLTMLLRDVYIFLWSLLFIVPGIVKSYSYRLVPYILADSPEISGKEAFMMSRCLMCGNKWRCFVLDLSFLGWRILDFFTLGILGIFFVNPYVMATRAEFYREVRYGIKEEAESVEQ